MPIDILLKEATGLPDKYVEMAVSYIHFLQVQSDSEKRMNESKPKRNLGIFSDRFYSMADDFDATPDCFEEYL